MKRQRLDALLFERGVVESREQGRRLIMAGQVTVNNQPVTKAGALVSGSEDIRLKSPPPFVSRAGIKLQAALDAFRVDVTGWVVADIGASTGGFTDCLLQRGANRVYAIDVGYGQLAWKLRQDPRVSVLERVNARYLEGLPEPIDLATFDVSFISLELVIPPVLKLLKDGGFAIALIKPQFEAGRDQVGKGGVVKDPAVHRAVLRRFTDWSTRQGLAVQGLISSPIKGPAGNREFLTLLRPDGPSSPEATVETWIEVCVRTTEADESE